MHPTVYSSMKSGQEKRQPAPAMAESPRLQLVRACMESSEQTMLEREAPQGPPARCGDVSLLSEIKATSDKPVQSSIYKIGYRSHLRPSTQITLILLLLSVKKLSLGVSYMHVVCIVIKIKRWGRPRSLPQHTQGCSSGGLPHFKSKSHQHT